MKAAAADRKNAAAPDQRMVADDAQLHKGVVDVLEGLLGLAGLLSLHLTLHQLAQRPLVC